MGHVLDSEGYAAIPAKDIAAGKELLREHRFPVDILVIDALIPHASRFIARLRQSHPQLKVIGATPTDHKIVSTPGFDAILPKPAHFTEAAWLQWVSLISGLCPPIPLRYSHPRKLTATRQLP
jgi:DNA-binding response OmpR family regulator